MSGINVDSLFHHCLAVIKYFFWRPVEYIMRILLSKLNFLHTQICARDQILNHLLKERKTLNQFIIGVLIVA
jgi:hypothetical protein